MSNGTLARAVLDKLVDEDLIEVEDHDEAVAALTSALDDAPPSGDWVPLITGFLDECAMIDEIYGTDPELEAAIKSVLASAPPA